MTLLMPPSVRRKGSHIHLQILARVSNQPSLPTYFHKTTSPQMAEGTLMLKFEFARIIRTYVLILPVLLLVLLCMGFVLFSPFFLHLNIFLWSDIPTATTFSLFSANPK